MHPAPPERPRPRRPWPRPADPAAAERLRERFADLGPAEAALAATPAGAGLLAALGGNSPYLSDLAVRDSDVLVRLLAEGPDPVVTDAMAALAATAFTEPRPRVAAAMRRAKRHVALAVAVADIGGAWRLDRVTAALSDVAEATLALAVRHLARALHDRGDLHLPDPAGDPARGCGLTVLGMGKLGARELNYSSDVDLVLLYDPAANPDRADTLGHVYTRLARDLVSMMEARSGDGYVFRADLRLRPDPAATPPAVSLPAAIAYYESMGQNWERAAMTKARPVAGDHALGHAFLAEIRPFVWRRHLDFAAVADIHAMKRRIDAHRDTALESDGDPAARVAGHDVKLGEGGIREIEFLAQTLQLVWGGRDPGVRDPTTLGALRKLVGTGRLPCRAAAELAVAYRFLRAVEHRLQMVADRQTHAVPEKPDEVARFAVFMGYPGADAFARALLRHLGRVRRRYAGFFETVPDAPAEVGPVPAGSAFAGSAPAGAVPAQDALEWGVLDEAPAKTVAALRAMGFRDPGRVVEAVRDWRAGRPRATRSDRARELLDAVLPPLLAALGRQREPDAAFARFDALLVRLPAGVQLLSMFQRNPALLDRVAAVLGAAPQLADHLAAVPAAVEGLLQPGDLDPDPARTLSLQMQDARALDEAVDIARRTVRAEEFRLCVAQMEGAIGVDEAGSARTALADAALSELLPRVMEDHVRRYGTVRGGGVAVVLLGKAGSREMMAGSDLDLMLIYDHPEDVTESTVEPGTRARPAAASHWFIRAAHAFVAALTAPGGTGPLYAVDMRLRPSGNKGPVAVSLPSFRRYHAEDAWTWERMALTRARVVAVWGDERGEATGDPAGVSGGVSGLRARVEAAIRDALAPCADPAATRADAAAMRGRMLRDLPPAGPWDVKLCPGGQVEVEFVAQVLQLIHGARDPTTRRALEGLAADGVLPGADAAELVRADRLYRTVQSTLRITVGRAAAEPPPAAAEALVRAAGRGPDLPALRAALDRTAHEVRAAFVRHIGEPG